MKEGCQTRVSRYVIRPALPHHTASGPDEPNNALILRDLAPAKPPCDTYSNRHL